MTSRSAATSSRMLRRYSSTVPSGSPPGATGAAAAARLTTGRASAGCSELGTDAPLGVADEVAVDRPAGDGRRQGADVEHARPLVEEQRRVDRHTRRWPAPPTASSRRRMPCSPDASQAMAVCGRSPRILPTSWVSTRPGPASTKTRCPAAYMASICSTKRTGAGHLLGEQRPDGRPASVGVRGGRWWFDQTGTAAGGDTATGRRTLGAAARGRAGDDRAVEGARHRDALGADAVRESARRPPPRPSPVGPETHAPARASCGWPDHAVGPGAAMQRGDLRRRPRHRGHGARVVARRAADRMASAPRVG